VCEGGFSVPTGGGVWSGLLVFCCNYVPIVYRFRDITTYWSKICVFFLSFYAPQSRLKPSQGLFLCKMCTQCVKWCKMCTQKNEISWLPDDGNCMILRLLVLNQYQLVTDGQTDTSYA